MSNGNWKMAHVGHCSESSTKTELFILWQHRYEAAYEQDFQLHNSARVEYIFSYLSTSTTHRKEGWLGQRPEVIITKSCKQSKNFLAV